MPVQPVLPCMPLRAVLGLTAHEIQGHQAIRLGWVDGSSTAWGAQQGVDQFPITVVDPQTGDLWKPPLVREPAQSVLQVLQDDSACVADNSYRVAKGQGLHY